VNVTDPTNTDAPRWLNRDEAAAWRGLLTVVQRAFPEIERDLRSQADMLAVHYHILVTLSEAPGNKMRLTDLANSANLSQSRLTHRLGTLIERGEVEIRQDPEDRRAKNATLTEIGQRRLEAVAPGHVETVRRLIFDHLSPSQTVALARALTPVSKSLCDHPEYLNPKSC
jgi:DNA-binding MarR family transcriptional regulator